MFHFKFKITFMDFLLMFHFKFQIPFCFFVQLQFIMRYLYLRHYFCRAIIQFIMRYIPLKASKLCTFFDLEEIIGY